MKAVFVLIGMYSALSLAVEPFSWSGGEDVVAPVYNTNSATPDQQTGSIIFDLNGNVFKGYDHNGALQIMSLPSGVNIVGSSGSSERVERAIVSSACSSSPCTIASQSGSWLTSITRSATGTYSANISGTPFSAAPTCVCNNISQNYGLCRVTSTGTSTIDIYTQRSDTTAEVDSGFSLICMGPR